MPGVSVVHLPLRPPRGTGRAVVARNGSTPYIDRVGGTGERELAGTGEWAVFNTLDTGWVE